MAHIPRFDLPGQPQHVNQRGNNRSVIFVTDEDYRFFLEKLHSACHINRVCPLWFHGFILLKSRIQVLFTCGLLIAIFIYNSLMENILHNQALSFLLGLVIY